MAEIHPPFWTSKTLAEMTRKEWESLCDGCGRCCVNKLEDENTGDIFYTNVSCRLLDDRRCRCRQYKRRAELVSDCVVLEPGSAKDFRWLPKSCAYRRVAEGRDLEWWHPLVSGDRNTVHEAGISVRGKVVSEKHIHPDQFEQHLITWID